MFKDYIIYIYLFLIGISIYCYDCKKKEHFDDFFKEIDATKVYIDGNDKEKVKKDIKTINKVSKFVEYLVKETTEEKIIDGDLTIRGNFNHLPTGSIIAFNSYQIPNGWVICDGKNGTPDLRNRFIFGSGNNSIGKIGGEENVTLTQNQMPRHNHSMLDNGSHSHKNIFYGAEVNGIRNNGSRQKYGGNWGKKFEVENSKARGHSHSIYYRGFSHSHNNMPPYYVLNYIMKL